MIPGVVPLHTAKHGTRGYKKNVKSWLKYNLIFRVRGFSVTENTNAYPFERSTQAFCLGCFLNKSITKNRITNRVGSMCLPGGVKNCMAFNVINGTGPD